MIVFNVLTANGREVILEVKETNSVRQIKLQIAERLGIAPHNQRLFAEEDELFDTRPVLELNSDEPLFVLADTAILTLCNELEIAPWRVTDSILEEFIKVRSSIMQLSLKGTYVTDKGISLLARFSELTYLDLSRFKFGAPNDGKVTMITDKGLAKLATSCVHLEELRLGGCRRVKGGCLQHLLMKCPKLRSLHLRDTSVRKAAEIAFLTQHGHAMHSYSPRLSNVDDEMIRALGVYFHSYIFFIYRYLFLCVCISSLSRFDRPRP